MKNLFKKLHSMPNQSKQGEGSTSSKGTKSSEVSLLSTDKFMRSRSHDHKPFSGLSNWLNTVTNRKSPSPPSSSNVNRAERSEPSDSISSAGGGFDMVSDAVRPDSGSSTSKDPDVEEEYQIQLALELSAREDPEAVQIEAVKQISLGSCDPENTPAEVVAYRYWNYNSLSYDDKISDGFYDLYGVLNDMISERMPSLIDLQGQPFSNNVAWEAVLVNRAADANLLKLEQRAREISVRSRLGSLDLEGDLVRKLAVLVSEYMGGSVSDPVSMSRAWRSLSYSLKATLGSMVLPLGSLTIGLPRHRALMFKVLADSVGIRCRLVKGRLHTGSDDAAMNFVKLDGEREFIVDLMAAPGTLIPPDAVGSHIVLDDTFFPASPFDSRNLASSSSGVANPVEKLSEQETLNRGSKFSTSSAVGNQGETRGEFLDFANFCGSMKDEEESKKSPGSRIEKGLVKEFPGRTTCPHSHARSPSWTEGVSSPAAQKKKVKDFSKRMIQAAKENPDLAQKLHDVLVESGVVAPSNIFTEICPKQSECPTPEVISPTEEKDDHKQMNEFGLSKSDDAPGPATFLPPLPHHRLRSKASPSNQTDQIKQVEEVGVSHPLDIKQITGLPELPHTEAAAKYVKNVPVAAAAAAAAAVVASSMVAAAAAKSSTEAILELPMAAAAAVMATTAVTKQYDQGARSDGDTDSAGGYEPRGSGDRGSGGRDSRDVDAMGTNSEGERTSDRSAGNDSSKSDVVLDDVAEYEILWEEIKVGERIGLGSYGEVYHGEWHGTEVAVKRFLDQDISGETLEEFKQEVRIMKRLRHPNVVLFMGAVTRAPNLSIVTEFLPRGSLYRLLHRPNNQLDERRRLRVALDTARGMNYLHSSTPVIVHRDLKSPNLLVDKNWVVKVCDFGLSRMKHSTFLSSKSTAGTAEWMAPEVLRNEPSDEKSDVYSYGVILWELSTMQQPWGGMNPMQVVGAVGFQHRRLDIPDGLDPAIADIIRKCWQTDPKLRPTFAEIMAALKPLQKPITSSQVPRPLRNHHEKGQPSHEHEED